MKEVFKCSIENNFTQGKEKESRQGGKKDKRLDFVNTTLDFQKFGSGFGLCISTRSILWASSTFLIIKIGKKPLPP